MMIQPSFPQMHFSGWDQTGFYDYYYDQINPVSLVLPTDAVLILPPRVEICSGRPGFTPQTAISDHDLCFRPKSNLKPDAEPFKPKVSTPQSKCEKRKRPEPPPTEPESTAEEEQLTDVASKNSLTTTCGIKIVKRGEALPKSLTNIVPETIKPEDDNDPVKKTQPPAVKIWKRRELFAGSACSISPSPRCVPIPDMARRTILHKTATA